MRLGSVPQDWDLRVKTYFAISKYSASNKKPKRWVIVHIVKQNLDSFKDSINLAYFLGNIDGIKKGVI